MSLHEMLHLLHRALVCPIQSVKHLVLLIPLFILLRQFEVVSCVEAVYIVKRNSFFTLKES